MLRGPQTPGELKQRAERLQPFAELPAIDETLDRLIERGMAERLPRRPGQKEERYAQLLEDERRGPMPPAASVSPPQPAPAPAPPAPARAARSPPADEPARRARARGGRAARGGGGAARRARRRSARRMPRHAVRSRTPDP